MSKNLRRACALCGALHKAHARRRFHDIAKAQPTATLAHEALAFIGRIYQIEARAKEHPPDERGRMRQAETVPLLSQFKSWLEAHYRQLLPQGPLAQAMGYVLSNWQALTRFTDDGMLAADSNLVERTIRPIATMRSLCPA
jgi:hypothetical protein